MLASIIMQKINKYYSSISKKCQKPNSWTLKHPESADYDFFKIPLEHFFTLLIPNVMQNPDIFGQVNEKYPVRWAGEEKSRYLLILKQCPNIVGQVKKSS